MGAKLASRARGGRRGKNTMSEINVTPLVDVMLVLLVIFMITAPLMTAGVSVDLPKTKAKAISDQDNVPLEISLDAKGNIYIGDTKMTEEQMLAKLQALAVETTERRVYIRADQRLDYGKVVSLMASVNALGFNRIALITDPAASQKK